MQRVVSFYEKLPRGPAPEPRARGPIQWYQLKYMSGKNPSAMRTFASSTNRCGDWTRGGKANGEPAIVHIIGGLMLLGYAQNYYFHLRKCNFVEMMRMSADDMKATTRTTRTRADVKKGCATEGEREWAVVYILAMQYF